MFPPSREKCSTETSQQSKDSFNISARPHGSDEPVGVDDLLTEVAKRARSMLETGGLTSEVDVVATRQRHVHHLRRCCAFLLGAEEATQAGSYDMAAEEIRLGLMEIGHITGRVDAEEILDIIFQEFCIGK